MAIAKNQIYIYEISTFSAFTNEENSTYNKIKNKEKPLENKEKLKKLINNCRKQRIINKNQLNNRHLISLFENDLTRWIENNKPEYIDHRKTSNNKDMNIMSGIVTMKIKHYDILKQILDKGIKIAGKRYEFYTASAGQIRRNKITLVEKSIIDEYEPKVMCGLSPALINKKGGINNSKYLAYKALPLSASLSVNIDIDKTIVVPDMELYCNKYVEYIDNQTFESKIVNLKELGDKLDYTDGCGMISISLNKDIQKQLKLDYKLTGFQIRAPWIKGALFPFDFNKFCKINNQYLVTDIYGVQHDIQKEDIQIIFTESQFKMHKYYDSWDSYKKDFKENELSFTVTATNNDYSETTQMSYQFLQTLDRDKMTESNIKGICDPTVDYIKSLHTDVEEMYKVFGADKANKHLTPMQEALLLYPSLLNDKWFKNQVKNKVKSVRNYALAAKLRMPGFYGYMMPDLYAYCEWLFLGKSKPEGILLDNTIYCDYYGNKEINKCDLLRSPHLSNEHTVRIISHSDECKQWFKYCGQNIIYSIHDFVALSVQGDVDGDTLCLVPYTDETKAYFDCIKPHYVLYYRMFKAPSQEINQENIYNTLIRGYENNKPGKSIGDNSNAISKDWNTDNLTEEVVHRIKLLTMLNNFTID